MRHSLNSRWAFWVGAAEPRSKDSYGSKLHAVGAVETAEEFWGVFNALPDPAQLPVGSDLALFREGVQPMWEDPQNVGGGRVQFILREVEGPELAEAWRNTVLMCIGETLPSAALVTGVAFSQRQAPKVSLWVKRGTTPYLKAMVEPLRGAVKDGGLVIYLPHQGAGESIIL